MSGIGGLTSATTAATTQQLQVLSALQQLQSLSSLATTGDTSSTSGVGLSQNSATISSLGQLFSSLNQLQTQNPTEFKQIATQLASELQTASQQQSGSTSQFLTQLSSTLEQAATTGSLPDLRHQQGTQQTQTYNSSGQPVASGTDLNSQTSFNASLQQLFATLNQQVSAALTI
jgi:hypothetical protein